ncbi:MAG TPA: trypsin-like serine protease [Candidatus Defluviicoccus seviourii]|nr:trypsin-like serine protease [Candidatus Defluviicoccus seviourii]
MGTATVIGAAVRLTALLLALTPTTGAAAEKELLPGIGALDRRVPIESTAWPWAAIGRLNTSTGRYCTATLIARDAVVTAAHCVHDPRTGRRVRPSTLHFLAGYQRGTHVAHAVARSIQVAAPDRTGEAAGIDRVADDWAIVTLAAPLSVRPIPVRRTEGEETGAVPKGSLLRAGYSQDRPHLLAVHEGCSVKQSLAHGRVWLTDCDATRGDSGSPVLVRRGDTVDLVGITAAVTGGDTTGSLVVPATAFAAAPKQ